MKGPFLIAQCKMFVMKFIKIKLICMQVYLFGFISLNQLHMLCEPSVNDDLKAEVAVE
jgi:hypothetical protein